MIRAGGPLCGSGPFLCGVMLFGLSSREEREEIELAEEDRG